jgi:hypothetical protein
MGRLPLAIALVFTLSGCDLLFPEFSGTPPDLAGIDAAADGAVTGGVPRVAGRVCALADVRDYRTCGGTGATVFRITIEETRDVTMTDNTGAFSLPTARPLTVATVAAVDPVGNWVTTISQLTLGGGGVLDPVAIPVIAASAENAMSSLNGFPLDPTRGGVLAYTVDANGTPVAGVHASPVVLASGPYYDGAGSGEVTQSNATSQHGLVALFDVPPPSLNLAIQPPAPFFAGSYPLPIRPNTLTITAIPLR